jgi:two-component system sensor kinase FixL
MVDRLFKLGSFGRVHLVVLMLMIWRFSAPAYAQSQLPGSSIPAPKRIVLLYSYGDGIPAYQQATRAFLSAMNEGRISVNNLFFEYLDLERNKDTEHYKNLITLLLHKYAKEKIDLIVTVHTPALRFLLNEGKDLFPKTPALSYLAPDTIETAGIERRVLILPMKMDFGGTLELAQRLFPQAVRVVFINGVGEGEKRLEREAKSVFVQWRDKLEFEYTSDLSVEEMLQRIATLPSRTIVIYSNVFTDKTSRTFVAKDVAERVAKAANAPVFGMYDTILESGIIGGSMFSFDTEGARAGTVALDILRGKLSLKKPVTILTASRIPIFDWQQLKRWGVSEIKLPKETIFVNRPSSFWNQHKRYVIGVSAFILAQLILIVVLLLQITRRKSAEESLKQKTEELDQFFNISLDLFCIANTEGYFLHLSPVWEKVLGFNRDELMSMRFVEFVHPDDVRSTLEAIAALASQKAVTYFMNRYRCKDGTYRWLEWSAAPTGNLIYAAARDVTRRKLAEQTLEERLQFERLLTGLSARFVKIRSDQVDSEIERGLRQVLEFFQVDRCGLIRTLPGRSAYQITHVAYSEDVPPVPAAIELPISINPWAYEKLILKREVVAYSRLDELPPEANVDKQTWSEWGIRSNVNIPIFIGEPVDHIISINSVKSERVWPEQLFPRLQLLGEIFVNALERKQIRLQIEERLRFEGLVSHLSAGFVNLPPDEVDSEINNGLRSITEFFDADRCTLGLFSEDGTQLMSTFEYHSAEAEPAPESLSKEQMPWYIDQLIRGNPVVMNRVEDLPPEAEKERQLCLVKGMKSVLSIPMVSGGKTLGSCALVLTHAERVWPEELVQRFRLIGEVFANVLQHRRAEAMLRTSEEKFRQFFSHTPEYCYIISPDGMILDVNNSALGALGYKREELVGKPLATIYAPESLPKVKELFEQWKNYGEINNEEMVIVTRDGEKRVVLLNVGTVRNKDGAILYTTSTQTDITERKRTEAEAFHVRRELLCLERSSRMGELTASLAHELNQPLTSILSNARAALRFLQSGRLDFGELKEILQDIANDDKRAGDIIRSLRAMMKQEEGEREPIFINDVLQDVVSLFHSEAIIRSLTVEMDFADPLPLVHMDKVQIQQVLVNLMMNAAESMVRETSGNRKIFLQSRTVDHDAVQVAVRDFGPGVEEKEIDKIFEPFFTTKRSGLGMGLSVSRSIIEAHGGHIWVKNNPDKGATFYFDLPAIKSSDQ